MTKLITFSKFMDTIDYRIWHLLTKENDVNDLLPDDILQGHGEPSCGFCSHYVHCYSCPACNVCCQLDDLLKLEWLFDFGMDHFKKRLEKIGWKVEYESPSDISNYQ